MEMNSGTSKDRLLGRIWRILPSLLLIVLILIVAVLFIRIKGETDRIKAEKLASLHKNRPPVNVVVLEMKPIPIRDRLNLPAQADPWVELNVLAEVSGKVVRLAVSEGDHVKKGAPLAFLDKRDYENELASVKAEYKLAMVNLERAKKLFREKLITAAQIDSDTARVEMLAAAARNAELRLERCTIRSPITGIVNSLDAKKGLYLNVQDVVAVILDISRVKVKVGIPESDVDEVRQLDDFEVVIDALGSRSVKGRRFFLSKSPGSFAHLYNLEIEVRNPDREILPGMFATVNIVKREVKDSISVPIYSVITRADEKFVFVEMDGRAHVRMVETGILEGWMTEITKGLQGGDRVIVVGQRSVAEGQEVNVVRTVDDPEDLFK